MDYQGTLAERQEKAQAAVAKRMGLEAPITLFPTTGEIEQMENGPSSPIPGSEWAFSEWPASQEWFENSKPEVYFDAVRLQIALSQIAQDASHVAWQINEALRNVRLAESARLKSIAVGELVAIYENIMRHPSLELNVRLLVNDLANTIDPDVAPEAKLDAGATVYPSRERYYTFRPVWEFIYAVRKAFKRSDS